MKVQIDDVNVRGIVSQLFLTFKKATRRSDGLITTQYSLQSRMCLALTLTISHAPRLHILLYVREYSPIIISKLQLCGLDSSCSAPQLWRANSYAERRINYEHDSLDPRAGIVNDSCGLLHLI